VSVFYIYFSLASRWYHYTNFNETSMKNLPNIELSTKPQITLDLPSILHSYIRFVFDTPTCEDYIILNRKHEIGKLINAMVLTSDVPVRRPLTDNPVKLILPVTENNVNPVKFHFIYVSPWGEEKIRDYIDAHFRLWIKRRFEIGYELNYEQRDIVEAILRGLNERNQAANFDAIKKIDYRNRRKIEEKRFKKLLNDCIIDD
jgi:hypothetical protein